MTYRDLEPRQVIPGYVVVAVILKGLEKPSVIHQQPPAVI